VRGQGSIVVGLIGVTVIRDWPVLMRLRLDVLHSMFPTHVGMNRLMRHRFLGLPASE